MGWLWAMGDLLVGLMFVHFNSTMGWLWGSPNHSSPMCLRRISIPLWDDCEWWFAMVSHWNNCISIPLWDDCESIARLCYWRPTKFQFHYGMIVSEPEKVPVRSPAPFQFHYGMIVSRPITWMPLPTVNFNSTMGWLWGITLYLGNVHI